MHFDGKNITDVLLLPWILMGNKPLVTKLTTVYFYDTVKIVHLKIDKYFFVHFSKLCSFHIYYILINTSGRQLHFVSSDDLVMCYGVSENSNFTWETLEADYKDFCSEDLSLNISHYSTV